jgi:hypothetical protein
MIGSRRRVLRELVTTAALPRVIRWQPVLACWLVAAAVLAWKADDIHDAAGRATLLRVVAVLLVVGVVNLVDDDAAGLLAPVPVPLAWRRAVRLGLAVAAVAAPWAAALLWVRPGHLTAGLTLECAAITGIGLAMASGIARWSTAREAGLVAGPAVVGTAVVAVLLPPRWALYAAPGDGWNDAHLRWAAVLGLTTAGLALTLRDPASRTPHVIPGVRPTRSAAMGKHPAGLVLAGAVCGLAWAAGLRGMMAEIAGPESTFDWSLTFGWLLAPGVIAGALLGWAEHLRRTGGAGRWRWLALSPLAFAGVLFSQPGDLTGLLEDGIGGGALAVPLFGIAGGYALSGRGPLAARIACAVFAVAPIPVWAMTATRVGGPDLALDTPRGAWVAVLFYSFLAVLAIASAIPHRAVASPDIDRRPESLHLEAANDQMQRDSSPPHTVSVDSGDIVQRI